MGPGDPFKEATHGGGAGSASGAGETSFNPGNSGFQRDSLAESGHDSFWLSARGTVASFMVLGMFAGFALGLAVLVGGLWGAVVLSVFGGLGAALGFVVWSAANGKIDPMAAWNALWRRGPR